MTDPDLFEGVVDLVVPDTVRAVGGLALLLCHADGRLMQALTMESVNAATPPVEAESHLTDALADAAGSGVPAVVVVIARPGSGSATDHDLALRRASVSASGGTPIRLLGVALAVPGGVTTLATTPGSEAA
ncbi:hypothetical protein [Intrasporangium sp. DVR]|uniref:hypothetical protein n=1 Tax=Intrasporangium sp. DVR TaxID=3127867 RepID=UPI0033414B6E